MQPAAEEAQPDVMITADAADVSGQHPPALLSRPANFQLLFDLLGQSNPGIVQQACLVSLAFDQSLINPSGVGPADDSADR
jgi:hypothetical protein